MAPALPELCDSLRRAAVQLAAATGGPPVSVLDCFARMDHRPVVVLEDRLHAGLRGGLQWLEGRWLIIVNEADGRAQVRFTLAHELGHLLLGDGLPGAEVPGRALSPAVREALCDTFAAELLLPSTAVRALWRECADVGALARVCEVSEAAARRRVRELGLGAAAR